MNQLVKISLFFLIVFAVGKSATASDPPETVAAVDLNKYIGLWYEIARMPNSFQKQCAAGTTAEYRALENGRIQVINKCYKSDGSLDEAQGVARVVDTQTKAKLQVSFVRILGKNRFWGDYWIIGLDENYRWAVVGHPKRKYGWILNRTPEMDLDLRSRIDELLKEKGYDPKDFINTPSKY
jgi:apolipoprotein D and lipocalin family protein